MLYANMQTQATSVGGHRRTRGQSGGPHLLRGEGHHSAQVGVVAPDRPGALARLPWGRGGLPHNSAPHPACNRPSKAASASSLEHHGPVPCTILLALHAAWRAHAPPKQRWPATPARRSSWGMVPGGKHTTRVASSRRPSRPRENSTSLVGARCGREASTTPDSAKPSWPCPSARLHAPEPGVRAAIGHIKEGRAHTCMHMTRASRLAHAYAPK